MIEPLIPHPTALIESMRSIGYRPHTALADLVDNSITAGSRCVQIEIMPFRSGVKGWLRVEDDGIGMDENELLEAMRWGGRGPGASRKATDLGRFGLGLKTASFSLGRRLTVISRKSGVETILCWDLDHISQTGQWQILEGLDSEDEEYLTGTRLRSGDKNGTIVLITKIDRLRVDGHTDSERHSNEVALFQGIKNHLSLVFHRFIERKSLQIRVGAGVLKGTNLFGPSGVGEQQEWLKSTEYLSNGEVKIRTFILPHYKDITIEEHDRLAGPLGWGAHQGFLIYRADRLIVPGGWLGFWRPEEHCKLARTAIDLPNHSDANWGLDVIKSKVSPPSILKADLERIGAAARKQAMETYRFYGERTAPTESQDEPKQTTAFWVQITGKRDVKFKINRAHPLVESLIQALPDPKIADAFIHSFERLLPISAILQNPAKATHGLALDPNNEELEALANAFRSTAEVIVSSGFHPEEAVKILITHQPFSNYRDRLAELLDLKTY